MDTKSISGAEVINLLLIEDDPDDALIFERMITKPGNPDSLRFQFKNIDRLEKAIEYLKTHCVDLILLDLTLPDSRGLETFTALQTEVPDAPVIVLSGLSDESMALEAVRKGAQDYLCKQQVDHRILMRTILYALERQKNRRELRDANERLEKLALVDPLTDLLNRRGFQLALSREIALMKRNRTALSCILIDIDDFKDVNDNLGYSVGDILLKEIAEKLKSVLRKSDYVARIGGDEFMILLPGTLVDAAMAVSEKLRLSISESPVVILDNPVKVTSSLGVINVKAEFSSTDELLSVAHFVLRKSKASGKNRVSNEDKMEIALPHEDIFQSKVFRALKTEGLVRVLKQPIFNILTNKIIGYEFLTRLKIPEFEMPDHFFRLCMETNILSVVDNECFRNCAEASRYLDKGLSFHLNLFPTTMLGTPSSKLIEDLPPDRPHSDYCIEISEKQIMGSPTSLMEIVGALKSKGVKIAIDDVGFGHSCLESLILLSPDIIKIDKACIIGISQNEVTLGNLKKLLKVAQSLGGQVIAEGIETAEDLAVLKELKIEFGQGYFLGRPA